ncbi:hypothetical protein FISHEDRAFT_71891 [Fistulina hepatica ATCC 64428]|uniref:F-box domain-containing protein n=1 Tax=Fistulina hepatica ATCC 64428 TaxID=1128425 RepID=A0A0D7AHH4_9AGAR|nr:hypothetical protein FISHEDRAFT_71891 [Fistulina hepatica ATCC 64428]
MPYRSLPAAAHATARLAVPFPLMRLPPELVFKIIGMAARHQYAPQVNLALKAPSRHTYADALSLCLVSFHFRQAAMPQLLQVVALTTRESLFYFIRSLHLQQHYCENCWGFLAGERSPTPIDCGALYRIMRGCTALGIDDNSLHVLYNALDSSYASPMHDWTCRRLSLFGELMRWNPLVYSPGGSAFLSKLTHLTIWPGAPESSMATVPIQLKAIPFHQMTSLTHLCVSLIDQTTSFEWSGCGVIYVSRRPDSRQFVEWTRDWQTAMHYGTRIPLRAVTLRKHGGYRTLDWRLAFVEEQGSSFRSLPQTCSNS